MTIKQHLAEIARASTMFDARQAAFGASCPHGDRPFDIVRYPAHTATEQHVLDLAANARVEALRIPEQHNDAARARANAAVRAEEAKWGVDGADRRTELEHEWSRE